MLFSRAFIDLRKIKAVQRAFTEPPDRHTDALDVGGDEGLRRYPSRSTVTLRFRRSFVLLMENGRMFHFEVRTSVSFSISTFTKSKLQTHSCVIAQQWVDQLSKLVSFWKQRHREDATREMKISDAFSHRMDIHYSFSGSSQLSSVEPDNISKDVSLFWNLCPTYDCQPITLTGRLFVRRKLRGQYRYDYNPTATKYCSLDNDILCVPVSDSCNLSSQLVICFNLIFYHLIKTLAPGRSAYWMPTFVQVTLQPSHFLSTNFQLLNHLLRVDSKMGCK